MAVLHYHFRSLAAVPYEQTDYYTALVYDYSDFIAQSKTPVDINDFLSMWTCLTDDAFEALRPGDVVYNVFGKMYCIAEEPFLGDESDQWYIEAHQISSSGVEERTDILARGSVYYHNSPTNISALAYREFYLNTSDERRNATCLLKPLLITKTKPQQS